MRCWASSPAAGSASPWSPSIRRARSPAARCSATACAWASTAPTRRVHPLAVLARPLGGLSRARHGSSTCSTPPASTRSSSRPSAPGSRKSRSPALADTRIVVCPPGLGDDVQAIKAGILEIADLLVVNKADLPAPTRGARARGMLTLRRRKAAPVPVLRTRRRAGRHRRAGRRRARPRGGHGGGPSPAGRLAAIRRATLCPADPRGALRALAARDAFVRHCGIEFVDGGTGHGHVRMRVGVQHMNFNGTCHGGAPSSPRPIRGIRPRLQLARCHCRGRDRRACHLPFSRSRCVTATHWWRAPSRQASAARLSAVYRVDVVREHDQKLVSTFTGTAYITGHPNEPLPLPPAG